MTQNPTYEQLLAENQSLHEEIKILRKRLGIEDIEIKRPLPYKNKLEIFMSLFRGRNDVYAKRWYSEITKKSGYSPVCLNEWDRALCDKRKVKCAKCPNRKLMPLNEKVILNHINSKQENETDVIGLYPLTADECCYFLAVDFDDDNWQNDITAFRIACTQKGIIAAIERSRSGNGGHAWFFFEDKIPAATARKFGSCLLTHAMSLCHEIKFKSYDRLFPNQDTMPLGGFGNLIALPFQGFARTKDNSLFVDEKFIPYEDQWAYLSNIPKLSLSRIEEIVKQSGYDDGLGTLAQIKDDEEKPWEKKKSPQKLTQSDFIKTVSIVKSNMLHIDKTGISQNALNQMKRLAAFKNPDFYKAQAMRLPIYNKPRIIDCTEETADYLSLPRGCENDLSNIIKNAGATFMMADKRNAGLPIKATFAGELRHEQHLAAHSLLQHETGVLSATTAFGKTVIGAYLISQMKVNTLILVEKSALLEQWKKSLSQFLMIDEPLPELPKKRGRKKALSLIGQIGSAKDTLNGKIDIAIMQSLISKDEVKDLVKHYGMVIVDECHHVSAYSFEKILKEVTAKYIYGLTATPTRQDGLHPIIFMQCGAIRYRVNAKEQAQNSSFERYVVPRFTRLTLPVSFDDSQMNFAQISSFLAENDARNQLIISDVINALKENRTPIVLAERKEHVNVIADGLEGLCPNVIRLVGALSAKIKREVLERLAAVPNGEQFVIVATGKYVGEGFDEPRLDTLFLAAPISWKGRLQQYAGRLHRLYAGKKDVIIYDYVDIHIRMLENMYHKRLLGYSTMGYKALSQYNVEEKTNCLFDSQNFLTVFEEDVKSTKLEIVVCSPFLRKARIIEMLKILSFARLSNARITVITRPSENFKPVDRGNIEAMIELLLQSGIKVITKLNIHQKFALIDQRIIWYGSINLLSYGNAEESIMRFEDSEIAAELVRTVGDGFG